MFSRRRRPGRGDSGGNLNVAAQPPRPGGYGQLAPKAGHEAAPSHELPLPKPLPPPPPGAQPPPSHAHHGRKIFHFFTTARITRLEQKLVPKHPAHITSVQALRARPPDLGAETYHLTPALTPQTPCPTIVALVGEGIVATDWAFPKRAAAVMTDRERFEMSEKTLRRRRRRYRKDRKKWRQMEEDNKTFSDLEIEELDVPDAVNVEWGVVEFSPPESEDEGELSDS